MKDESRHAGRLGGGWRAGIHQRASLAGLGQTPASPRPEWPDFEEASFETRAVKLLAVYDRTKQGHLPHHPFSAYKLFFRCEITGGAPAESIETSGAAFFRENEIPELSLARVTAHQITRMFEHYRHPEWPTDFD